MPKNEYHVLNLGAGVQSTALYLMFHEGILKTPLDAAIFADTQDEPAEVYKHLAWLESLRGPTIIRTSAGQLSTGLMHGVNSTGQRWITIPAFTIGNDGDAAKLRRQCSKEYKIRPIQKAIRRQVVGLPVNGRVPRSVQIYQYFGISLDESGRAARIIKAERPKYLEPRFPLIEMLHMSRDHCIEFLRTRVPHEVPKSACRFCPFHNDAEWLRLKAQPAEWAQIIAVDAGLRSPEVRQRRRGTVRNEMYLHRSLVPIDKVILNDNVRARQSWLGFSRECMGVCGL